MLKKRNLTHAIINSVFTAIEVWEQSTDNGETWNTFDGHYVKKSEP